jgi:type I restriction enzyme, S subunit
MSVQTPIFDTAGTKPAKVSASVEEIVGGGFDTKKFAETFGVLAESVGALPRLRQLVLTMAVSGRLTRQMQSDGDAEALLAKLGTNNTVARDAGPFTLPRSWRWARFLDVASIDSHLVDPAGFPDLPHVAPDNIEKATGRLLEYRTIREDGVTSSKHRFFPGQIVYSKIRPNLSKVVLVDFEGLCSADMYPLTAKIDRAFLQRFMLSPVFLEQVVKEDNRLAMPKVNQEQLGTTRVAVPPLAEQKRIVAKVDELMRLLDDLEAKQTKRRETQTRLRTAALDALTSAEGPEEFEVAWNRAAENFGVLFERADGVGDLRGAIRNLAIMGTLSTRQAGERSAADLLEQISEERERRVRAGELRRTDSVPVVQPDEVAFSLPTSWSWTRLGALCFKVADGPHFSPKYVSKEDGVPFLSGRNIKVDGFELESVKFVSPKDHATFIARAKPELGDVLYTKGGTTGVALVNTLKFEFSVWVHVAILKLDQAHVFPHYVALALNSPHCYAQSQKLTHGTGNRDLGLTRMIMITIPLPPLQEQKRVVAKVEHLMKLCDDLEAKLHRAETTAAKLVEAVVSETVG